MAKRHIKAKYHQRSVAASKYGGSGISGSNQSVISSIMKIISAAACVAYQWRGEKQSMGDSRRWATVLKRDGENQ